MFAVPVSTAPPGPPLVRVEGLCKSFGGVRALSDVTLDLHAGEVHALVGENGAGKSTLIKILGGSLAPDAGRLLVNGKPLLPGVRSSEHAGVAVIHQESVAFPHLSAIDNVFVGREPRRLDGLLLDRPRMRRETRALLQDRLGEHVSLDRPLGALPLAQRQMVAMARALSHDCRLLVMDEPTASLSARETDVLFRVVRQLRAQGVGILYVSHRLEEVFQLADRVTVLRDGHHVATRPIGEVTRTDVIRFMAGREVELATEDAAARAARPNEGPIALDVQGLTRAGRFTEISFTVRAGEIVGLAGLVGAGRSEVAQAIFGVDRYDSGTVRVSRQALPPANVSASIANGLAFVPEDRQHLGLVLPMSVGANLTLVVLRSLTRWGLRRGAAAREVVDGMMRQLHVRAASPRLPAESLSGGNQQKLVVGKWLAARPRVLILDEPTRGVDVAAKAELHRLIRHLARDGMATLLISSELPEVLGLSDRVLVMRQGRIVGELSGATATQERVLSLALHSGMGILPMSGDESHGDEPSIHEKRTVPAIQASPGPQGRVFFQLHSSPPRDAHLDMGRMPMPLYRRETWVLALLVLTVAAVGALHPSFLSLRNALDIAADASPAAIIACAMTLVIVTGEIDISVGSLLGLCAAVMGLLCYGDDPRVPIPAAVAASVAFGLGVGMLNGLLVTLGRVPSIIVTLGMLTMLRGVTKLLMKGQDIYGRPEPLRELATGTMLGVPNAVWVAAVTIALTALLVRYTPLGRRVYAVGSNAKAAPLAGISVTRIKFVVFALSGLMTGVATVLLAPRNSLIQPNMGDGMELLVVTCVVVGGASISGGVGTVAGTVLAVMLLGMVPTVLTYVGAPPQWRLAIQGGFILAAVLADHVLRRGRTEGGAA